jgi:prolyl 4-hydroxylase
MSGSDDDPLQQRFERVRGALASTSDADLARRHFDELEALASDGHAEAMVWCGTCYQFGMVTTADVEAAHAWYRRGREAGAAAAAFRLGDLHAGGHIADADLATARELFREAMRGDHLAAACQLAYLLDQGLGGEAAPAEATEILDRSAQAGSLQAQLALAERLARGDTVDRDPAAAMFWAGRAATQRYPLAADLYRQLGRDGAGPATSVPEIHADDARAGLLAPSSRELIADPQVSVISDLMSIAERAHLIRLAAPMIRPSRVVRQSGDEGGTNPARSSGDMVFRGAFPDVVVRAYVRRVARLAGLPVSHCEPLVVLHYGVGDEYTPHFDFFDDRYTQELSRGGQRIRTVLGYLNTVTAGGATGFPMLGREVPAVGGAGLMFDNVSADGAPDTRSLHAGRPVEEGQKWTATLWFREHDFPA